MSGATSRGWPYLDDTDEVKVYPEVTETLANKLEVFHRAIEHGEIGGGGGGGGAGILSGDGPPDLDTGDFGNVYLDTTSHTLYGPKRMLYGTNESLGEAELTPEFYNAGPGSMMGMKYQFTAPGNVLGITFPVSEYATATGGWEAYLFSATGTLLASKNTTGALIKGQWNTVLFDTPVPVVANTIYVAAMWVTGDDGWIDGPDPFPGALVGHVYALADGEDGPNGLYLDDERDAFPTDDEGQAVAVSPIFNPGDVEDWPIAMLGTDEEGSTILSGTAAPVTSVGELGNYYLDADDHALYGPKQILPGVEESLSTTLLPSPNSGLPDPGDEPPGGWPGSVAGMKYRFLKTGKVTGIMFFVPNSAWDEDGWKVFLFGTDGTILGSKAMNDITYNAWNTAYFDIPVSVQVNTTYVAGAWHYYPEGMAYGSVPFGGGTTGNVVALATGVDGPNGVYGLVKNELPTISSINSHFCVTPVFTEDVLNWPLAFQPGSTVLSGTATPATSLGALGDFYLDTDNSALYGPKDLVGGPNESLDVSLLPGTYQFNYSWMRSIGMRYKFATSGHVVGIKFFSQASGAGWKVYLFANDGTMLGSQTNPANVVAYAWNTVMFNTPVAVEANTIYMAAVYSPFDYNYFRYSYAPYPGGVTGNVICPPGTGSYSAGWIGSTMDYPPNTDFGTNQQVTPVFSPDVPNWPMTLSGTIILQGSSPTTDTGALGNYYLSTGNVLYGPKRTIPGPEESLPTTSISPSNYYASPTGLSGGMKYRFKVDGTVTAIKFYAWSGVTTTTGWQIGLFAGPAESHAELASKVVPSVTPNSWNTVAFDTPIPVKANTTYIAAYMAIDPTYGLVRTSSAFAGTSSGNIIALANDADGPNAVYGNSTLQPSYAGLGYGVSVTPVFRKTLPDWPLALTGTIVGSTVPDASTGSVGSMYLASSTNTLYGPKALSAGPMEKLTTNQLGLNTTYNVTGGMRYQFAVAGKVHGLKFYVGGSAIPWKLYLWTSAQVELASKTVTGMTTNSWNTVLFDAPISVTANTEYIVGIFSSAVWQGYSAFTGATNGNVTALAGSWSGDTGVDAFPRYYGSGSRSWAVTPVFAVDIATWPIALVDGRSADTGTIILSGTATPTGTTGALGQYYLDTDDSSLYGPKRIVTGTDEWLNSSLFPIGYSYWSASSKGGFGMKCRFAAPGRVTGVKFYSLAETNTTAGWQGLLLSCYRDSDNQETFAVIATKTVTVTPGTWNTAIFDTPVTVAANTTYVATYYSPHGYTYSSGLSVGLSAGNITLIAEGVDGHNALVWGQANPDYSVLSQYSSEGNLVTPIYNPDVQDWPLALAAIPPVRRTVTVTTGSLVADAMATANLNLAPGFRLMRITTSAPCRFRCYTTPTKQSNDAGRALGYDPTGDHGLILEFASKPATLSADLTPIVDGFDGKVTPDGVIACSITNTGTAPAAITVTLVWMRTE